MMPNNDGLDVESFQIPFPAVTICPTIPTDSLKLRNILEKGRYGSIPLNKVSEKE
jgi:hypothetical protein